MFFERYNYLLLMDKRGTLLSVITLRYKLNLSIGIITL